ncbi:MAG: hypothetical protein ACQEXJ_11900 [Myxococcota bacterium]
MGRRRRLRILVDDGESLNLGRALRMERDRLLIDVGVQYHAGSPVTLYPLTATETRMLDLSARVVDVREDVLVPADAEYRYLVVLEVCLDVEQRAALERYVDAARAPLLGRIRRRSAMTHDPAMLQEAVARLRP